MCFPGGSNCKECACNARDLGSIPGLGRSPGEGNGNPLQYSYLEYSTDRIGHGVTKSWTWLSNWHFISVCIRLTCLQSAYSTTWIAGGKLLCSTGSPASGDDLEEWGGGGEGGWGGRGYRDNHGCSVWCWRRLLRVPWTARRSNQPS